ncbi:hypothetical protein, partial [Allorhizocola rhizosphaerae]|uniref:hypothetical protein n=1 Tax=Allorhizocola rhizosphaerae TaxID=1872709 RepID=UPI0013C2F5EC
MTRDRRRKAEIRAHQATSGTSYSVASRQITAPIPPIPPSAPPVEVEILPPLPGWSRPLSCRWWASMIEEHGPLIAVAVSRGDRWWALDDLAREAAGALQDQPTEERGLWVHVDGRFAVTRREHLEGIAAALAAAGASSRLMVRAVPDPVNCEHASCRRRRGQPPVPRPAAPAP